MRKTVIFIFGFFLGLLACVVLVFLSGVILSQFSIQLYESEFDQQRNFNVFLIAGLIFGFVGGLFALKRFSR